MKPFGQTLALAALAGALAFAAQQTFPAAVAAAEPQTQDVVLRLTLPAAHANRLLAAVAKQYGYAAQVPDPTNPGRTVPNPVSRRDFVEAALEQFILQSAEAAEKNEAAEESRRQAGNDIRSIRLRP